MTRDFVLNGGTNSLFPKHALKSAIKGIWQLIRPFPVIAWSWSGILLGCGAAIGDGININTGYLLSMLLASLLLQGVVAHACNDREDWRSGTDPLSPGILSGGSGVIEQGIFAESTLFWLCNIALAGAIFIGIALAWLRGPMVILFLLIGVWAGIGYSAAPLRLAYRPFAGEWLAAFPAVLVCVIGSAWLLGGSLHPRIWLAGIMHGLFSLGWLMQHHLPDIYADLKASPPKITTPALFYNKFGRHAAELVPTVYFIFAALFGFISSLFYPIFMTSVVWALLCCLVALNNRLPDIDGMTRREVIMIMLSVLNCFILGFSLAKGI